MVAAGMVPAAGSGGVGAAEQEAAAAEGREYAEVAAAGEVSSDLAGRGVTRGAEQGEATAAAWGGMGQRGGGKT